MKEEWLFPNAVVPVDAETTAALVAEVHRLIDVVGGMALAQPEQEPVAYWIPKAEQFCFASPTGRPFAKAWEPLYTSPPQRQPLTDEEIAEVAERMEATDAASSFWRDYARAIEAKLKEKNT